MMTILSDQAYFEPDWPAHVRVRGLLTTRLGGVSQGRFSSLNLGVHVGDEPSRVVSNRALVTAKINAQPVWLNQVHGTRVVDAALCVALDQPPEADAAFSRKPGVACVVMTADCLPVLFGDDKGTVVAAAHAGWRGLLAGVLEKTIAAMDVPANSLIAYLGPAIGPQAFDVGDEVCSAFLDVDGNAQQAFVPSAQGKWKADLYQLARQRLRRQGVGRIFGGASCTFGEPERFFSYRRDGQTGRMASMVWLAPE